MQELLNSIWIPLQTVFVSVFSPFTTAVLSGLLILIIGLAILRKKDSKKTRLTDNLTYGQAMFEDIRDDINAEYAKAGSNPFLDSKKEFLESSETGINMQMYFGIMVVSIICMFVFSMVLTKSVLISLIVMFVGYLVPDKIVELKMEQNQKKFNSELIKILRRLAGSMRSGSSLSQALEDIIGVNTISVSARNQFEKVLVDINYGVPIPQAFLNLYERTNSEDVKFLAIAIETNSRVGGSLAQMFDSVANSIAKRNKDETEINAALSGSKTTAKVLFVAPYALFFMIKFMSPGYFDWFYETFFNRLILFGCFGVCLVGGLILFKVSRVKGL